MQLNTGKIGPYASVISLFAGAQQNCTRRIFYPRHQAQQVHGPPSKLYQVRPTVASNTTKRKSIQSRNTVNRHPQQILRVIDLALNVSMRGLVTSFPNTNGW